MKNENTTGARSPAKQPAKRTTGTLSCSCTSVQSAIKSFYVQTNDKKESGSWNGASGSDCTCGGKNYKSVNISFPDPAPRDVPALLMPAMIAASGPRPFSESRRRFLGMLDEMDRDFPFW